MAANFRQHRTPDGYHGETGLLFAAGPGVVPGSETAARIEDLMPTILWSLDTPIPDGVDGSPLYALFAEGAAEVRPAGRSEQVRCVQRFMRRPRVAR